MEIPEFQLEDPDPKLLIYDPEHWLFSTRQGLGCASFISGIRIQDPEGSVIRERRGVGRSIT